MLAVYLVFVTTGVHIVNDIANCVVFGVAAFLAADIVNIAVTYSAVILV